MTCIVGLETGNGVLIGGDSASSSSWNTRIIRDTKVFLTKEMIIGYTTSFRLGQLIKFSDDYPPIPKIFGIELNYLVNTFIPYIRKLFKEGGYSKIENNVEEGGQFMIGLHGKLYTVESDFSVSNYSDGFNAIGIGADYALGALAAMEINNDWTDGMKFAAVDKALKISEKFCNGVKSPFTILQGGFVD